MKKFKTKLLAALAIAASSAIGTAAFAGTHTVTLQPHVMTEVDGGWKSAPFSVVFNTLESPSSGVDIYLELDLGKRVARLNHAPAEGNSVGANQGFSPSTVYCYARNNSDKPVTVSIDCHA